jgi:uncharacterized membrane protein (DUF106 family)
MNLLDIIWGWLMHTLAPYGSIPYSTFLIVGVAGSLSLITTAANRALIDVNRMKAATKEIAAWRKDFDLARKTNDKKLLAKVMKRQKAIMELQSKIMMDRMKVSFMFLLPFWAVWIVLSGFFTDRTVANAPFAIPFIGSELKFFWWYLISSFSISLPLTRVLGVNPEEG